MQRQHPHPQLLRKDLQFLLLSYNVLLKTRSNFYRSLEAGTMLQGIGGNVRLGEEQYNICCFHAMLSNTLCALTSDSLSHN